jgi:hypothetical protein
MSSVLAPLELSDGYRYPEVLDREGHVLQMEKADETNEIIRNFLKGLG